MLYEILLFTLLSVLTVLLFRSIVVSVWEGHNNRPIIRTILLCAGWSIWVYWPFIVGRLL